MSRIGTFGASQMYLTRIMALQNRMNTEQIQVSTEKKSTNYTGVALDSNQIVNLENEKARADSFVKNNNMASVRMKAASTSLDAIQKTMSDYKKRLDDYASSGLTNQKDVEALQTWAYNAMVDLQSYLAANIDGQYLFSGGRVANEPVNLPASSLKQFQTIFDGNDHTYPTTRTANMADFTTSTTATGNLTFSTAGTITAATAGSLSGIPVGARVTVAGASAGNNQTYTVVGNTGTQLDVSRLTTENNVAATISFGTPATTLTSATTTNLTFSPGGDTITAAAAGSLASLPVGTAFRISGSASNDGIYQVAANTGTQITIQSTKIGVNETVGATISASSWYQGDTLTIDQSVDVDRTVALGITAADPAFEKAFRAMGLIAQGSYGTAGGLENNMQRVDQARALMQDALSRTGTGTGPFGTELNGDIATLQAQVGVVQNQINSRNDKHKSYAGFLGIRITELENVDKTEAVTRLMDDKTALETSYQALANVRSLTLMNYLK